MKGIPPDTCSKVAVRDGNSSWIVVTLVTPGAASSISHVSRDGASDATSSSQRASNVWTRRRGGSASRTVPTMASVPPRSVAKRRAGLPIGLDGAAVVVAERELRLGDGRPHPIGRGADEDLRDSMRAIPCLAVGTHGGLLHERLKGKQNVRGASPELVEPAVVEPSDGDGVEVVEPPAAAPMRDHQPRLLQDAQVLHDRDAGHLGKCLLELAERLAIALIEPIQQPPAGWIRQRPKDLVTLLHARENTSPFGYMSIPEGAQVRRAGEEIRSSG